MEYIKNISIDPIDNSKAIKVGFAIIIGNVVVRYLFDVNLVIDLTSLEWSFLGGLSLIILGINIMLRIMIASWAGKIAIGLNRSVYFWTISCFIFPSIGLIGLGFMDIYIADDEVNKIIEKCRAIYRIEQTQISQNTTLSKAEKKSLIADLKVKFEKILQENLVDFEVEARIREIHSLDDEGILKDKIDYNDQKQKIKDAIVDNLEGQAVSNDDSDNCPACGYRINDELLICPDCGLTLK